jgi:hypothetical protein
VPGVALPDPLPMAEPALGAVADPEPPPTVLELVPVPGEPPPGMVDGIEDVDPAPLLEATSGHFGP